MQYLLLLYGSGDRWAELSEEERAAQSAEYEQLSADPAVRGGAELQPASTATTVRSRNGEVLTTDGPFAETKEQLGGYYLIEARDLDEALDFAARIPAAKHGGVEVRPLVEG